MTGLYSLSKLLDPLQPEVCLLDLSPASCTGPFCDPTCHSTHTRQQNRDRLSFVSPLSLLPLPFSFPFPFLPFLPFSLVTLHLPDVHRRRRVWSRVSPKIVVGSLCPCPLSHVRTQGLVGLTICQGNHVQEITVSCWCVFHHSRFLDRLLEVCICGNSVLHNVFLPRSEHVTKVAPFAVHLILSGTWVEDSSQEHCCAISTFALVLFFEHSPCFKAMTSRNQRDQRQSLHFVMSKACTVLLVNRLLSSKPSCLINDDCSVATSRCVSIFTRSAYASNFTLQLFQFASEPSKFGIPVVFLVSKMPPASADMTQGLAARFTPTTGSRIPTLLSEQQKKTSQAAFSATLQPTKISTQHCRGNPAPSRLRYHVRNCTAMKGTQWNVCVLALSWLDEMSVWHSVNTSAQMQRHQYLGIQNSTYNGPILVAPLSLFPRGLVCAVLEGQFSLLSNGFFNPSNCHLLSLMWFIREPSLQDRSTTCLFGHVYANLSLFLSLVVLARSRTYALILGPFEARRPSL